MQTTILDKEPENERNPVREPSPVPEHIPETTIIVLNTRPLIADPGAFKRLSAAHQKEILEGPSAFEQLFTREEFLASLKKVSRLVK